MTPVRERLSTQIGDRYLIERELGTGGMATVYLAEDVRHHRKVAIKVLHPELSAVLGTERFLKEIELTANLQHPHILPLFDSGSADGLLYYVMPFVAGESLRARLDRDKQLSISDSVRIGSEVADALEYAHQLGIVHRDIKPENILLQGGHALVADFGIALAVQEAGGARMTQTGLSLGTPQYMAPEQAMGERDITARADIYALGAVAYEMIAGEPPFTGPNSQAIVARVLTETPRPLSRQRHTAPEHVEAAVMTALEKLPADRFETAAQFSAAIRGDQTVQTHAKRLTAATQASARSNASLYARVMAIAVALGIGAIIGWIAHRPGNSPRPAVSFSFAPDSLNAFETCCGFQVAVSPDERWVAFVGVAQGTSRIYIRMLDDLASRPVAGTEGAMEVFVSPDGQSFGYRLAATGDTRDGDYELRKIPAAGGSSVLIALTNGWPYGAAWMPDGTIIYASEDQPLHRVPSDGGTATAISGTESAAFPHSIGGGSSILFSDRRDQIRRTRMVGLDGRNMREVIDGNVAASYSSHGFLLSVTRAGALVAQRFDPGSARLSGSPVTLAENLSRPMDYAVGGSILFHGEGNSGVALTSVDMKGNAQLLPARIAGASHFDSPHYSPDGRRLAVISGGSPGHELYVVDLDRGTNLRMTFSNRTEFVDWTPDGRRLIYATNDSLLVQPADRSAPEHVMLTLHGKRITRVSVGGRHVAFAAHPLNRSRQSDIYVVPLDSGASAVKPYLVTTFQETAPAMSPDGRWIAYVSDETGRPEVYAGSIAAGGAREAISSEGGREPVWSRDGGTLYYRTLNGNLIAATVTPGTQFAVAGRTSLFQANAELSTDGADFDVHPNGESFLMMHSRRVGNRLVVITNAFARLTTTR